MAAAQVKPGDLLGGKYRVERVLGIGGMGMVVAARHTKLGQRVALKVMLKEALADPGNAERFAREARAAVQLQSPHTARVLDVGKLKNGEPYMVMEYLDGQDLDDLVRSVGALRPHVAVDYILQACEAFAEAHALGMIHRDIKLKNMFLAKTLDGRPPVVKVLDFGLAKTVGNLGDVSLTATSSVFGSPQYMSPEQMRSAKDVDARSDIWSIGVSLYELLTTRVPFDAPGVAEICAMVLKDAVEPPSKWVSGLPPELDAIVVKCLAKNPNERFQTVAELAVALEPWSEREGSSQRILHVMRSVDKLDVPTLLDPRSAGDADGIAKTLDAWDSGERTRGTKFKPRALFLAAFAALAGVGLIAIALATLGHHEKRDLAAASAMPPAAVATEASAALLGAPATPAPDRVAATPPAAPTPPAPAVVPSSEPPAPREPDPVAPLAPPPGNAAATKPPHARPPTPSPAVKAPGVTKPPPPPPPPPAAAKPLATAKPVPTVPSEFNRR